MLGEKIRKRADVFYDKIRNIDNDFKFKRLVSTVFIQMLIQCINMLSGIMAVRLMSTKDYALYTLSNTMLSTIILLSDGGIAGGILEKGGNVWDDKNKLGNIVKTGLALRKKMSFYVWIIGAPILFYILNKHNNDNIENILVVISLVPALWSSLSDSIYEIPLKLNQKVKLLQKNQLIVALYRFILNTIFLGVYPWTPLAITAYSIPRIFGNIKLKKYSSEFLNLAPNVDLKIKKDFEDKIKRRMPELMFYCFSSQISLWIVSILGGTKTIADIGVLGRLNIITSLFLVIFNMNYSPHFAKIKGGFNELVSFIKKTILSISVFSLILTIIIYCLSEEILWVFGDKYSNIQNELVLYCLAISLNIFMGCIFNLNISRGWIINPFIYISISVTSIVFLLIIQNVSTLKNFILYNIEVVIIQSGMLLLYAIKKLKEIKREEEKLISL